MTTNCDQRLTRRTQGSLGQKPSPASHEFCVPPTHFLIANLELELHVSPIRISELKFPNRKYFAIFCVEPRHFFANSPAPASLIETPRLEFPARPTKQSSLADPNRDKNGLSWLAFHPDSDIRSTDDSLCDSVPPWPALTTTLTLLEPQSNLPASCFVRALAGEHSL
jgi:hypothetical protein